MNFNWAGRALVGCSVLRVSSETVTGLGKLEEEKTKKCTKMVVGIYLILSVLIASPCLLPVAAVTHQTDAGNGVDDTLLFKLRSE